MAEYLTPNKYDSYKSLVEDFGINVVRDRFNSMQSKMDTFLKKLDLSDKTRVSQQILANTLLNYFDDIARLKDFHKIKKINYVKIHAYMAFWVSRCKPIQIIKDFPDCDSINERFITCYLINYLLSEKGTGKSNADKNTDEFFETLFYHLRYRRFDAQTIELVINAFQSQM